MLELFIEILNKKLLVLAKYLILWHHRNNYAINIHNVLSNKCVYFIAAVSVISKIFHFGAIETNPLQCVSIEHLAQKINACTFKVLIEFLDTLTYIQ